MKIHTILSVLAFAAPALAAPKRKRVFKIYTPEEVRRLESYDDRMLKKTKEPIPSPGSSMSMPTAYPTKSPKTEWPTKSPKVVAPKDGTTAPSVKKAEDTLDTTTAAPTKPERPPMDTAAPTPAPVPVPVEEALLKTNEPTVSSTTPPIAISTTNSPTKPETVITSSPVTSSPVTSFSTETKTDTVPTWLPTKSPTWAPATYAPVAKLSVQGVEAPEAPSGAMTIGTAVATAVVACAMIFV